MRCLNKLRTTAPTKGNTKDVAALLERNGQRTTATFLPVISCAQIWDGDISKYNQGLPTE